MPPEQRRTPPAYESAYLLGSQKHRSVEGSGRAIKREGSLTMDQEKSTATLLTELSDLFGPPPVLSTENAKAYDEILARLMQCFAPQDFMEQSLIKQLADWTWEMMRYTRHKTLSIERKFRQRLEFIAKRAKDTAQNRDAQGNKLALREPSTE